MSLLQCLRLVAAAALRLRCHDARVAHYRDLGYRYDEGMLVVIGDTVHAGADAMHVLALWSERGGLLNRLQRAVFMHHWLSRLLYPGLRAARGLVLRLRRVPAIDAG